MHRLFVISDLHLGGRPDEQTPEGVKTGFQFCHSYKALAEFVDWVDAQAQTSRESVELVINGDIVDFLAEDDYEGGARTELWTADQEQALSKLQKVIQRTREGIREGKPDGVFDALRRFVSRHKLTLLLGNHDVELSLPKVRRRLVEELGGESPRLRFVYDGEAYVVGRVLIEHGNRYDRWNQIDWSGVRQERSVLSRGLRVEEKLRRDYYFVPPAGTHLVLSFMNPIKAHYRFVDLLKPEDALVLPLLAVLEPDKELELEHIKSLVPLGNEFRKHGLSDAIRPKKPGDLSQRRPPAEQQAAEWTELGPEALNLGQSGRDGSSVQDLGVGDTLLNALDRVQRLAREAYRKIAALSDNSLLTVLRLRQEQPQEERLQALHGALVKILASERSFDLENEMKEYLSAAKETARQGDFDVILYGHTHLPKQIQLKWDESSQSWGPSGSGRAFTYINTGTWADVMRFPVALSGSYETDRPKLSEFLSALKRNELSPYIQRYLSYAEVEIDPDGRATGALRSFLGKTQPREPPLTAYRQ